MAIKYDGKVYSNLQEQVGKNTNDIKTLVDGLEATDERIDSISTEIVGLATKTEVNALSEVVSTKANANDVYTKSESDTLLNNKANTSDVYNKTEANSLLNAKANKSDVYNKTEFTDGTILNEVVGNSEIDIDDVELRAVYSQDVKGEISIQPQSIIEKVTNGTNTSQIGISATEIDLTATSVKKNGSEVATVNDTYTKSETNALLNNKQDTLTSGSNIKTINNNSILGSGNINIASEVKTLNTANWSSLPTSANESISGTGTINLHKVAKTGNYNDLINKPAHARTLVYGFTGMLNDGNKIYFRIPRLTYYNSDDAAERVTSAIDSYFYSVLGMVPFTYEDDGYISLMDEAFASGALADLMDIINYYDPPQSPEYTNNLAGDCVIKNGNTILYAGPCYVQFQAPGQNQAYGYNDEQYFVWDSTLSTIKTTTDDDPNGFTFDNGIPKRIGINAYGYSQQIKYIDLFDSNGVYQKNNLSLWMYRQIEE